MASRRSARSANVASAQTALRLSAPAERVRAAEATHAALLAKAARRKAALQRAEDSADAAAAQLARHVEPRLAQLRDLDAELHELLTSLTRDRSRTPHERAAALRVYRDLQRLGVLTRREQPGRGAAAPRGAAPEPPPQEPLHDAASAARPPQSRHGGLRALFRRLVDLCHPDKVQDDDGKGARTEAMKDITEAYRRGDLARLLELERRWREATDLAGDGGRARPPGDPPDDAQLEARLQQLERSNDELREQISVLERASRAQRKSPAGVLARALKRVHQAGLDESELQIVRDVTAAADELRSLRDFVLAFRDRRIPLRAFLRGPGQQPADDDYQDFLDTVTELAQQMLRQQRAGQRGAAKPSGRRGR